MGIYGASIVSRGVDKALVWADTQYPTLIMGKPLSTWANAALGIIPPVMDLALKKPLVKGKYQLPFYIISAHAAANVAEMAYNQFAGTAVGVSQRLTPTSRMATPQLSAAKVSAF
jgi:hypothetical protein